MNVVNSVLRRMAIILKTNKVNFFVSSVLFVFWYYSLNFLDTPRIIYKYDDWQQQAFYEDRIIRKGNKDGMAETLPVSVPIVAPRTPNAVKIGEYMNTAR
jgi:hypothetical protein